MAPLSILSRPPPFLLLTVRFLPLARRWCLTYRAVVFISPRPFIMLLGSLLFLVVITPPRGLLNKSPFMSIHIPAGFFGHRWVKNIRGVPLGGPLSHIPPFFGPRVFPPGKGPFLGTFGDLHVFSPGVHRPAGPRNILSR